MSYHYVPAHATGIGHASIEAATLKSPTQVDWERHRSLIKRLYVDEGKKLKEVMAIMKTQYGHKAT
jgi:hypothetical protein